MLRKRKKLLADFKAIFQNLSPEDQLEFGSALMLDVYLRDPRRLNRAILDLEISRLARRTEELLSQAKRISDLSEEFNHTKEN